VTRVSIVVPCFNGGGLVRYAVASALAQSHPDVEVVVVDDGSTDSETLSALREIALLDRARVITQTNQGPCVARNRGIEESTGSYILPLDHDDEIYPDYVSKAAAILDGQSNVGIVYARAERFGASSGEWYLPSFSVGRMLTGNLIFVSAMFRREDWSRVGGYSPTLRRGYEDHDFWLRILGLDREVVRLDEILFRYRDTDGSLVKLMTRQDRVDAFAHTFASNSDLYVRHSSDFAEMVIGQWEMLAHYKNRYGRLEDAISRLGAVRRRIRGKGRR
jgi:glycosyltransferase involved in cell wall biosynthesis